MSRRRRLDAELVRRGLARSREQAGELVTSGRVELGGLVAHKPATAVDPGASIRVTDPGPGYVSRGAHKLLGALEAFGPAGLSVSGRRCLDAGASTGGFTDVLLRGGAREVVAVDVGYGQLAWPLRTDERVLVYERTNVRTLTPEAIGGVAELCVADLSFISLRLVLPALVDCLGPDGDLVPMVKPQFEVGKDRVGAGGVVRDPQLRVEAVVSVADAAAGLGLGVAGVVASPLPGPSGNVEFFLWLRRGADPLDRDEVARVVEAGPAALDSGRLDEGAGGRAVGPESAPFGGDVGPVEGQPPTGVESTAAGRTAPCETSEGL
jgi:23S rRNA (cytidine1920-2'-O)/16S rRNA (cytidine1409-2'-O)-methyltransferase